MKFYVLTLFPEMIRQMSEVSIIGRAVSDGLISVDTVNIRDFSVNKYMRVDDYPYGGGAGMVMEAEPVSLAVQSVEKRLGHRPRVIYLTPQAEVLSQTKVESLAEEDELILLCGHYEGIDERVLEEVVDDYISIGDYVLTGGELGAMVLIDAVSRFVPGVLSNEESSQFESLQDNLLEYPQYTRPAVWHGKEVPPVLLSGDHAHVEAWRHERSVERTMERRPDLLRKSFSVTGISWGGAAACQAAEKLTEAVSRCGVVMDYDRRKLQREKRHFGKQDLLLMCTDGDLSGEKELSFAERFRNLAGDGTPCVLVRFASGEQAEACSEFPEKEILNQKGFVCLGQYIPAGEEKREMRRLALRIRIALESFVRSR